MVKIFEQQETFAAEDKSSSQTFVNVLDKGHRSVLDSLMCGQKCLQPAFSQSDEQFRHCLGFDRGKWNRAISTHGGTTLDDFTMNQIVLVDPGVKQEATIPLAIPTGMYEDTMLQAPGGKVERPPGGDKSFLSLVQDKMIGDHYSVARGVLHQDVDLTNEIVEQSSVKRKAEVKAEAKEAAKKPKHGSTAGNILAQTYWESPEAEKLFLGDSTDERDVVEVLEQRIEWLQQMNQTRDGWRDIVDKHDKDNLCSAHAIFIIRQRCPSLCLAYI
jgi:hypothetical protein